MSTAPEDILDAADNAAPRRSRFDRLASHLIDGRILGSKPVTILLVLFALAALFFVFTVPLAFGEQLTFAICCFVCAMLFRRAQGHYATLVMIMLSVIATGRYMYWRLTETTYWERPLDAVWGLLLVSAEVYAALVLMLGYFQTACRSVCGARADARLLPDRVAAQAQADAAAFGPQRLADRRYFHSHL